MSTRPSIPHLRGHHVICLQFFHGEGYSPEYVVNMMQTVTQLEEEGRGIVVEGIDDICAACPTLGDAHLCRVAPDGEDSLREIDAFALELLGLEVGEQFVYHEVREKIPYVLEAWRGKACAGCRWQSICASTIDIVSRRP